MESLIAANTEWKSGKASADSKLRMSRPPPSSQPTAGSRSQTSKNHHDGSGSRSQGMGLATEDLNSGFGRSGKNHSRSTSKQPQGKSKAKKGSFGDSSEDELDMFSQGSQQDWTDEATKVRPVEKLHTHDAIKTLSFRTKKTKPSTDTSGSQPSQTTQSKVSSKKENQVSRSSSQDQLPSLQKDHSKRGASKPKASDNGKVVVELTDDEAQPKRKFKPRPLNTRQPSINQERLSPEVPILPSPKRHKDASSSEKLRSIKKPNYRPDNTPTPSTRSDKADPPRPIPRPAPFSNNGSPQRPRNVREKAHLGKSKPKEGLSSPRVSSVSEQTKVVKRTQPPRGKKTRIVSSEEEDDDEKETETKLAKRNSPKKPKAQPFPMSTQYIAEIGRPTSPSGSSRMSISDSDEEKDLPMTTDPDEFIWEGDEDTITMSPEDHKNLCPYCDAYLPQVPSDLLRRLLDTAERKSKPDPRPWNRFGRKAPFANFIAVCQRHKFETELLPEAEAMGWPQSIDWNALTTRVKEMQPVLQLIVDNPIVKGDWDMEDEPRPRDKCVFWQEIVAEVKAKGAKVVAGFQGQFASFEKVQLGYYGELGSVIITQILYDLFPITSIDPGSVAPLTPIEFIQKVLVPETGARLIQEDQKLEINEYGLQKAVEILRESSSYGVIMFPADEREEDEEKTGNRDTAVADRIIMARAKKRRKELEEEEAEEADMEDLLSEPEPRKAKDGKTKTKTKRSKGKKTDARVDSSDPPVPTRPKPRPIAKPATAKRPSVSTDEEEAHSSDIYWQSDPVDPPSSDRKRPHLTEDEAEVIHPETRGKTPDSVKRRKLDEIRDVAKQKPTPIPMKASLPSRESSVTQTSLTERPEASTNKKGVGKSTSSRATSVARSDTDESDSARVDWQSRQRPSTSTTLAATRPSRKPSSEHDIEISSSSDDESHADWEVRKVKKSSPVANLSDDEQLEVSAILAMDPQATPRPTRGVSTGERTHLGLGKPGVVKAGLTRSTTSAALPPLLAARERAQRVASESTIPKHKKGLSKEMKNDYQWLLRDSSQSSVGE